MEFGRCKNTHGDLDFVGKGCAYILHIGEGKLRRYIQIRRKISGPGPRKRTYHSDDYEYLSPLIRVSMRDVILYTQVLKELLLGFKELPKAPSEKAIRGVLRKVAYKYGEPTDKAQTSFLVDMRRLNDKKRKVEKQGLIMETLHKGIRARTLAGKDRQLRQLVKMLEP